MALALRYSASARNRSTGMGGEVSFCLEFHLPAMIYASRAVPLEAIMMSILLEQEKALTKLEEETNALEARLRPSSGPPASA